MKPRLMVHYGAGNLGDTLQSVALSRLIGPSLAWFRDPGRIRDKYVQPPTESLGIANAYMIQVNHPEPEKIFFCGIGWGNRRSVDWLKRSPYPIGARDPNTHRMITEQGANSKLIGCATLTLPKYTGKRVGEICVDAEGPGKRMTHYIPPTTSYDERWEMCLAVLREYRTAALVHTTRLHVALPCLAMGTPIRYTGTVSGRTSTLKALGVERGKECCPDVSEWAEQYKDFLRQYSGIQLQDGDPVKPEIT